VLVTNAPANDPIFEVLRGSLRELGYEEGQNISLKIVSAEGQLDRLPALAAELVDQGVDVIIATNEVSTRTAQKATAKIPIVMAGYGYDPVSLGLVDDIRRPGGNITGVYSSTPDLEGKRLEVLKQAVPRVSHVAVLWDPAFGESGPSDLRRAAKMLHVRLEFIELHSGEDLNSAFQTAKRKGVGAALLLWTPMFYVYRDRVAALALETKLPTVSNSAGSLGTLLSYGTDPGENMTRTAYYVARLLKGAKPGDLPVEQLSRLKLTVNLKTAKALGIKIPEAILVRADEVIQ
jgi:putative ABC transport system substrate-binding protein